MAQGKPGAAGRKEAAHKGEGVPAIEVQRVPANPEGTNWVAASARMATRAVVLPGIATTAGHMDTGSQSAGFSLVISTPRERAEARVRAVVDNTPVNSMGNMAYKAVTIGMLRAARNGVREHQHRAVSVHNHQVNLTYFKN